MEQNNEHRSWCNVYRAKWSMTNVFRVHTEENDGLFTKRCWQTWMCIVRISLYCYLSPYTKIKWRWITDPNLGPEIIKLLKECRRNTPRLKCWMMTSWVKSHSPKARKQKQTGKWDYINSLHQREQSNIWKKHLRDEKNIGKLRI